MTRRWDRSELPPLIEDLLAAAAALESWLNGDGINPARETLAAVLPITRPLAATSDVKVSHLSRHLGISTAALQQWCRFGILDAYTVPAPTPYGREWVVRLIEAKRVIQLAADIRQSNTAMSDRAVAIRLGRKLREPKGISLSRTAREDLIRKARSAS